MVPGLREWELTETLTGDVARAAVEAGDWVSIESGSGGVRVTRVTYPGDSEAAALLQAWREQQA
jgi:hypothetical protein